MTELKKWAPGLKVLRFHGPLKERDRLKKIASGEIDMYGNLTAKMKAKLKARRTASGKRTISLDSDEEEDTSLGMLHTTQSRDMILPLP
jgi:SWI/SNF-related matrix-associated actin-dependent regulator of chromatin subfamily A member 5